MNFRNWLRLCKNVSQHVRHGVQVYEAVLEKSPNDVP
jgi:hypothetical protein